MSLARPSQPRDRTSVSTLRQMLPQDLYRYCEANGLMDGVLGRGSPSDESGEDRRPLRMQQEPHPALQTPHQDSRHRPEGPPPPPHDPVPPPHHHPYDPPRPPGSGRRGRPPPPYHHEQQHHHHAPPPPVHHHAPPGHYPPYGEPPPPHHQYPGSVVPRRVGSGSGHPHGQPPPPGPVVVPPSVSASRRGLRDPYSY